MAGSCHSRLVWLLHEKVKVKMVKVGPNERGLSFYETSLLFLCVRDVGIVVQYCTVHVQSLYMYCTVSGVDP